MSSGEDYSEYEVLLADVKSILGRSEIQKKEKIQELAKKLDWLGHKQKDIAQKIVADLKGYATKQHVYQCLDDKYKHEYERYRDLEKSTVDYTNNQEQNERETEKKTIVVEQSTSGSSQPNSQSVPQNQEPVTDKPNNDQYSTSNEEKPILDVQLQPQQGFRMVMSAGQFMGLIKGMTEKIKEKRGTVDYVIEYDAKEKALFVDFAEPGEARNIDG